VGAFRPGRVGLDALLAQRPHFGKAVLLKIGITVLVCHGRSSCKGLNHKKVPRTLRHARDFGIDLAEPI
jgi:hypothetical protein